MIKLFSRVFTHLEERLRSLDYSDWQCCACLHYVYVPCIQKLLDEWVLAWNSHPIRGCKNLSPLQLREEGFLKNYGSTSPFIRDVFDGLPADVPEDEYGIENEDMEIDGSDEEAHISISEIEECDDGGRITELLQRLNAINPNENDNNFGMDIYQKCLAIARAK